MQLPHHLKQAIEAEAQHIGLPGLIKASSELSDNYRFRQVTAGRFIITEAHRAAYAITRMPATFAASKAVLLEIRRLLPELCINSLLDLGAGAGAAAWAALDAFDELKKITLVERDQELIKLGKTFAQKSPHEALCSAEWLNLDLAKATSFQPHDLVICSYSLNEFASNEARKVLQIGWQATQQTIVIIEPGTMQGVELLKQLRTDLLQAGGNILAPCPHQNTCPMSENDWCHFAQRVERSVLHRKLKAAELGYEDEKYSYLAVTKQLVQPAAARVIRHPLKHSGYVDLQLCAPDRLRQLKITRSQKDDYKRARKIAWGEAWNFTSLKPDQ